MTRNDSKLPFLELSGSSECFKYGSACKYFTDKILNYKLYKLAVL